MVIVLIIYLNNHDHLSMDNVLIAQAIVQGKNRNKKEIKSTKTNDFRIDNTKLSYMSYKSFLEYMESLWLDKNSYDVKSEIQKYYIWSKNAESTYH